MQFSVRMPSVFQHQGPKCCPKFVSFVRRALDLTENFGSSTRRFRAAPNDPTTSKINRAKALATRCTGSRCFTGQPFSRRRHKASRGQLPAFDSLCSWEPSILFQMSALVASLNISMLTRPNSTCNQLLWVVFFFKSALDHNFLPLKRNNRMHPVTT